MEPEMTQLEDGDGVPVFCSNCKSDLRVVRITSHTTFTATYEYHKEELHFDLPEEPEIVLEELFCGFCREPVARTKTKKKDESAWVRE